MSSIPVDSVHHIEDVGHLLLEAQKDLARVRQRLEAMPLESHHQGDSGVSTETIDSLRDILNKTESNLRVKAEAVLKSVEENKINTLPPVTTQLMRYHGDFHLGSVIVQPHHQPENAIVSSIRSPSHHHATPGGSPNRRMQATLQSQAAYMRRPVGERMAEARSMELLSRPMEAQIHGGVAREFIQTKFGLSSPTSPHHAPSASISVSGTRPIERYGRNWRDSKLARGPQVIPNILPRQFRKTTAMGGRFPTIGPAEADQGILGLVQKGYIPPFVDVTSAFTSNPPPLQQAPVTFHNYHDQFKKQSQQIATAHQAGFNLNQVKLDLGEVLLDRTTMNEYEVNMLLKEQEEKQQHPQPTQLQLAHAGAPALEPASFAFPALMPGDAELRGQNLPGKDLLVVQGREDIDDLLSENIDTNERADAYLDGYNPNLGPRDYDELLDTYSLHQFLIRKGKVLSSTPEFLSFARKNHMIWGQVRGILKELEIICKELSLPLATISGNKVIDLAEKGDSGALGIMLASASSGISGGGGIGGNGLSLISSTGGAGGGGGGGGTVYRREDLFACFVLSNNQNQIDPIFLSLLQSPGKIRYTMGGDIARTLAAMKIQSTWRMYEQRKLYLSYRWKHSKAILIQRAWRRFQTILYTRQTIADRWAQKLEHWKANVQDPWKKSFGLWQKKRKVHIHIPSISTEPYQRQSIFNFSVRENSQLSRLCDIADPTVDVLYISPFVISQDIQSYYMKLLEVGLAGQQQQGQGKDSNGKDKDIPPLHTRVKILVPENVQKFPEYFSLSKQALYSPKLLKKIRESLRGRPGVLIPNEVGIEDLQLAVELGLPLWSGLPDAISLFGSKSGSKRIFAAAEIHVAPGAHDIYDEQDLYSYLAKLIVDHLSVSRWILKIDNESSGRGIGVLDTSHFKVISSLRIEKQQHASRWSLPEVLANAQERVIVALRKGLPRKIILATPQLYDGKWLNFAVAFFRVGGVIEAAPPAVIGSPSVNLLISPDGDVSILSSHDQVFSSAFVFAGANFPSSAPADLIHPSAMAIGKQCFREGLLGYIGIDFLAWHEGPGSPPKIWAVDLNLKLTATQASFQMFHFLMKGRYEWKGLSGTGVGKDQPPVHLRPSARYMVGAVSSLVVPAPNSSPPRSVSRTGLVSTSQSPSARMFGSGGGSTANSSRESSRPTSGQSTPKLPGIDRRTSANEKDRGKEEQRFYSTVPYLYQPHLATVQFGSFFNLCRLKGVSFDVRSRVGTVFMMMDSLASGSLGMMSIGLAAPPANASSVPVGALSPSPLHAMQLLVDALAFLNEQASTLRFGAHLYDAESNLAQMLIAYKGLVKAQKQAFEMEYDLSRTQLVSRDSSM